MIKVIKGINSPKVIDETSKNEFMAINSKLHFYDFRYLCRDLSIPVATLPPMCSWSFTSFVRVHHSFEASLLQNDDKVKFDGQSKSQNVISPNPCI